VRGSGGVRRHLTRRTDPLSIKGEYLPRVATPTLSHLERSLPDQQIGGQYLPVDRLILHDDALNKSETPSVVKNISR
jgi:hypothetical protein